MNRIERTIDDNANFSFENILQMRQKELKHNLAKELKAMGYSVTNAKGYLYAPGEIPVLLVAHLDTVHQELPTVICYSEDGRYAMSPYGIGGDDRSGVYMILHILRAAHCYVLFCEDEETGGNGAREFAKSNIRPKVNYIVELDRRGANDAVFYGCDNPDFTDYICEFGFKEAGGSFSDISVIAPKLKTAAVNISAGYYNEHRPNEYIDLEAMDTNISRVTQMTLTKTEHFAYMERKSRGMSFWGQQSIFDMEDSVRDRSRLLMPLPETARLILNGCELGRVSNYLMDRHGNVYAYLDELEAAVESENAFACDKDGKEIGFSLVEAKHLPILSFESAMEQLYT
ncbi:MAG: hypothetical protein PHY23_05330 [Oscillospiraceae bacterium]|nr:hypothetical protein [Oscillospiraceae bacterium]